MFVGTLELWLTIPEARTLKDKRRVVKSLKDRLGGKHNISIAEVDELDEHRRAALGIAMVANDRRFLESCLSKLVDEVRFNPRSTLVDYQIELI